MKDEVKFFLCNEKQDRELLEILETNTMSGQIELIYTAQPSYLESLKISGKEHYVISAYDEEKKLMGLVTITVQERYIEGRIIRIGYLSNLRIVQKHQGKGIMGQCLQYIKKIEKSLNIKFFMCSIVSDNKSTIRKLTQKKENYPYFLNVGDVHTTFLFFGQREMYYNKDVYVSFLSKKDSSNALKFLKKHCKRKNLFPAYKNLSGLGLSSKNFVVAKNKEKIVGLCAIWDQKNFKQVIVKEYKFPLSLFIRLVNSPLNKRFKLLDKNKILNFSFISHLVIMNDDQKVLHQMLVFIKANCRKNNQYVAIGLHKLDPLLKAVKEFTGFVYKSQLFIVSWKDLGHLANRIKNNVFYPEISLF